MITFNEVNHIKDAIKSIDFADEIIVIDSFSNDGTFELLKTFTHVKIIQREFKNFADQRNFAISKATYHWILFMDADERIPEKLKEEIIFEINNPDGSVGFKFRRLFYFSQKRIRFSGFQTDTTYRLFKKEAVQYIEDKIVHEMPQLNGKSKIMNNNMLHFCFNSAAHYKNKMTHYATLKAYELFKKNKQATVFHFLFRPPYKFITNYFFRLGMLDGKEGFIICYLSAYGVYYRYKELKRLHKKL